MRKGFNMKTIKLFFFFTIFTFSSSVFAGVDPETQAAQQIHSILFGSFGLCICAIILGATFFLAKAGKVTWDKFLFILFCTAGFLGSPGIVTTIRQWVGGGGV